MGQDSFEEEKDHDNSDDNSDEIPTTPIPTTTDFILPTYDNLPIFEKDNFDPTIHNTYYQENTEGEHFDENSTKKKLPEDDEMLNMPSETELAKTTPTDNTLSRKESTTPTQTVDTDDINDSDKATTISNFIKTQTDKNTLKQKYDEKISSDLRPAMPRYNDIDQEVLELGSGDNNFESSSTVAPDTEKTGEINQDANTVTPIITTTMTEKPLTLTSIKTFDELPSYYTTVSETVSTKAEESSTLSYKENETQTERLPIYTQQNEDKSKQTVDGNANIKDVVSNIQTTQTTNTDVLTGSNEIPLSEGGSFTRSETTTTFGPQKVTVSGVESSGTSLVPPTPTTLGINNEGKYTVKESSTIDSVSSKTIIEQGGTSDIQNQNNGQIDNPE